jgi:hypothetical protein
VTVHEMMVALRAFRTHLVGVWDALPLVVELTACPDLLMLLRDLVAEQSLNLIDAVEEHGEATVRAETVSDLDALCRVLRPAFRGAREAAPRVLDVLRLLHEAALHETQRTHPQRPAEGLQHMAGRARMCAEQVHALSDLHKVGKMPLSVRAHVCIVLMGAP